MVPVSIGLGALLIVLGLVGYIAAGAESITALIPAFFGLPILVLGLLGRRDTLRKHMMHAAAALALLGFAGSARGLGSLMNMLAGHDVPRPFATIMQSLMALLTFAFVVFAIKSFIDARRQRMLPRTQEQ